MKYIFVDESWEDYLYWQKTDKKKLKRINAVSYTHLDVYKRQLFRNQPSTNGTKNSLKLVKNNSREILFAKQPPKKSLSFGTVSYTHLDVYKRQTTCCPLPVSVVGRQIVIIQLFSEIRFAPTPIYQQVFAQKTGNNHPNPIVHITCLVELSHSCIYNRITCISSTPQLKFLLVISPFNKIVFCFK